MTVAAWPELRSAKEAVCCWLKQTTSHRPPAGRPASRLPGPAAGFPLAPSPSPPRPVSTVLSVGKAVLEADHPISGAGNLGALARVGGPRGPLSSRGREGLALRG